MERLLFKIPSDIKNKFAKLCDKRGLSMSAYVRLAVMEKLKKQK